MSATSLGLHGRPLRSAGYCSFIASMPARLMASTGVPSRWTGSCSKEPEGNRQSENRPRGWLDVPSAPLPFRAVVVASRDDPHCGYEAAELHATTWGAEVVDAGHVGHLDSKTGFGPWPHGETLVEALLTGHPHVVPCAGAGGTDTGDCADVC